MAELSPPYFAANRLYINLKLHMGMLETFEIDKGLIDNGQIRWLYDLIQVRRRIFEAVDADNVYVALVGICHSEVSGDLFDLTSFSAWLGIPRTNCYRLVRRMENDGLCRRFRDGRRTLLMGTAKGRMRVARYLDALNSAPYPIK